MLITALLFLLVNVSYVSKYFPGEILGTRLTAKVSSARYEKQKSWNLLWTWQRFSSGTYSEQARRRK
jgi:hypothetical protein